MGVPVIISCTDTVRTHNTIFPSGSKSSGYCQDNVGAKQYYLGHRRVSSPKFRVESGFCLRPAGPFMENNIMSRRESVKTPLHIFRNKSLHAHRHGLELWLKGWFYVLKLEANK